MITSWTFDMAAYFTSELLDQRYTETANHILIEWMAMGSITGEYYLQYPCRIDCYCSEWDDVPRISLFRCLYPGELDQFFILQPFTDTYDFDVRWHCIECNSEMSCGFPPLGTQ